MPGRVSPERWALADQLISDGKSNHEINRQTGISRPSISTRRKRLSNGAGADKPPNGNRPPDGTPPTDGGAKSRRDPAPRSRRPSRLLPSDEQLEAMCRKVAKAPAIPSKLLLRCDYCTMHYITTAPELAQELVEYSHEDPELRKMLEWAYGNWRRYRWAGLAAGWLGVPMLHHMAPTFIYGAVAPLMGMPPRGPAEMPPHQHAGAPAPTPAPAAPANGNEPIKSPDALAAELGIDLGALDMDQLVAMARQFGIELDGDLDLEALMGAGVPADEVAGEDTIEPDGDTEIPAGSDAAAEPAEAPAPAAEPDPAAE